MGSDDDTTDLLVLTIVSDMNGAQPSIDHTAHNALENISDILIQFVLQ